MSESSLNDILGGGGLSSLLQNPEVAAKLPRIMEALAPVMAEMRAEQNGERREGENREKNDAGEGAAAALAALARGGDRDRCDGDRDRDCDRSDGEHGDREHDRGGECGCDRGGECGHEHGEKERGGKGRSSSSQRRALLRALEPYLSDNRREAMDYICRVLSLIDILSEVM